MKFWAAVLSLFLLGCSGEQSSAADSEAPHPTGVVGRVVLSNDSGRELPARTITFGQIYRPGAVRPSDTTNVVLNAAALTTQIDPKALYPDGSVRHAIMSVELPKLSGGEKLATTIVNTGRPAPTAPAPAYAPPPPLSVIVTVRSPTSAKDVVTLDLRQIARQQANVPQKPWLRGAVAEERRYRVDINERLQVAFDVYTPARGPSRVDVVFHNDWNTAKEGDAFIYDVEFRMGGAKIFGQRNLRHYARATWHKLVWSDGASDVRVTPNFADLRAAGATPRYDPAFKVSPDLIRDLGKTASEVRNEPLDGGAITKYMPMTGMRWDIGPLPAWAVADLLQGNEKTRRLLLANADAAGAVPWHIREKGQDLPLSMDKYPDLWLDGRGQNNAPLPEAFHAEAEGWMIDDAHQPSLTYLPYLITGLRYYKDELSQQAAYVLLSYENAYRGGAAGVIIGANGEAWQQVRGLAWSLRTVANAAYILPADDPMQGYFDAKLKGNLQKIIQLYVEERRMRAAGQLEGWMPGVYRPEEATAPWQQGYLAIVLGWINDMGYADAGRTLGWMSNFLTGLFTQDKGAFDIRTGTSYILHVSDPASDRYIDTWAEALRASKDSGGSEEEVGYYGLTMRAALASTHTATGSAEAERVYDTLSKKLGSPAGWGDPTFAIVTP